MSNDNFAIEIDPPDDVEYDVEGGFSSSTCHLMHKFEEERPTSLVASIRESAKSSKRKLSYYCSFAFKPIKKLLSAFKLFIIIGLYSFLGAHMFMYLEVPTDLEAKEDGFHQRKIAREVMVLNLRAIYYDNREDREERWKQAILKFEEDSGLEEPVIETAWTFWMSFLYAGTIFTTIGYGNIACKTRAGQIATMIYAFVGIPIMLVMLSSLNNFLLKWIKIITNGFSDVFLYIGVRLGVSVIRQDEVQKRLRYTKVAKKLNEWKLTKHEASNSITISGSEENCANSTQDEGEEEEIELDPPVISTLFATVSWIVLSAAVFCLFEDWSFFTSFYFCFISLTTIGLGDVTPANPEYMIATFGVVIVGLSMLTVCIDVIKEKLAQMYMALLRKLLNDYMEAVKSGDPNAASAMMAGFQGRAKFLMPLISKNDGAKLMNKFKQDCSKKGIDPPPVLTNINPETGMPAFASAPKEEFRDYIEVADEKFAEEQQKLEPTSLSKPADFLQSPTPRPTVSVGVSQTALPLPKVSLEVQAGNSTLGKFHDYGSQTENESSDEGIQTDYSIDMMEEKRNELEKAMTDTGTQYEIVLLTSVGIQPEVSSVYIGAGFSDHSDDDSIYSSENEENESDYSSEEDTKLRAPTTYTETELPFEVEDPGMMSLGLKSPPIEITPFTDDESVTSDARSSPIPSFSKPTKLSLKTLKVEKSASVDSTDTVIYMKPEKYEEIKEKKQLEPDTMSKESIKRRRKKLKHRKTRGHELRFLKNSGNQTSAILLDCSTQYEIFTVESESQYDVKGRSRKCQTKLSSINHEQLQGIRETVQKRKRRESEMSKISAISESDWENETGKELSVAEISLDLSVVALGVDEAGKVVEVAEEVPKTSHQLESFSTTSEPTDDIPTTASESTSVERVHLDSEDEELASLEELELFTTDTGIQTETKIMLDKQDHATPMLLDVMKNCSSQTTISTFRVPQKVYESASTSSDESSINDTKSGETDRVSEQNISLMTSTGVQTMHVLLNYELKPEIIEEKKEVEEVELVLKEEKAPPSFTNSESQTVEVIETDGESSQTAKKVQSLEIQTDTKELAESDAQTDNPPKVAEECQTETPKILEVHAQTDSPQKKSFKCQTDDLQNSGSETRIIPQTETVTVECQADLKCHEEAEVQTELATTSSESVTEKLAVYDTAVQTEQTEEITPESKTEKVSMKNIEIQADLIERAESESQAEKHSYEDADMQTDETEEISVEFKTEKVSRKDAQLQAHLFELTASESQTEKRSLEDTEMQTTELDTHASESQTEQLLNEIKQTQTDYVALAKETQGIDQITQSESSEVTDSGTQYILSIEDRDVQATPISFETPTQHSIEIGVKSCQTDIIKKRNKKSQVEDDSTLPTLKIDNESQVEMDRSSINLSPIRLDVSDSFTMTVPGHSEEKEIQVDEECFGSEDTVQISSYSGPLWSDFDYTPDIGGEDEEVMDGETQTQDRSEPIDWDDQPNIVDRDWEMSVGVGSSSNLDNLLNAPSTKQSADSLTDEFAVQCAPESSDMKIQTVKFKKKKNVEKNIEAKVEMSTSTVQATTEMCEQSAGSIQDDWLQVYVQELDEERRTRMSDIGIQTGVLARVQHIYTRPISDDTCSSSAPITLRKTSDSSDHISAKTAGSSEESLASIVPGTAISAAESMDDHLWPEKPSPFASRHSSLKRRKMTADAEQKGDKTSIVQDLRAKFEMKVPPPRSPPKDDGEGSSSDPRNFF